MLAPVRWGDTTEKEKQAAIADRDAAPFSITKR